MFIIVGLGNKGFEYRNTYHNVGFMVADKLAEKLSVSFSKEKSVQSIQAVAQQEQRCKQDADP